MCFFFSPSEVFDPVWCRNTRWIIAIAAVVNGNGKCNAKNHVSVALSTANPPRTNWTISFLMYVTADSRLEITVAPQNDICPHGSTYPMNTVAVVRNRIATPTDHVCTRLYDCSKGFLQCVSKYMRKIVRLHSHVGFLVVIHSSCLGRCV